MEYRMKQDYLKNNLYEDNAESEKYLVEDITQGAFHKWNDKLEIITRVCDWYGYHFRFYSDGRLVMQIQAKMNLTGEGRMIVVILNIRILTKC